MIQMATAKHIGIVHTTSTAGMRNHNAAAQSLLILHLQSTKQTTSISSSVCQNKSIEPISNPNWNFLRRAVAEALNAVEYAITTHEKKHKLSKTTDPLIQISGNFAPVEEQPVMNSIQVEGKIPDSVRGVYVRNGANPQFAPMAGHHFFDGDGMIHAVTFHHDGSASYACRFTQTRRLVQEKTLRRPVFPKAIGELHGHSGVARLMLFYARSWLGIVDHSHGAGLANAGLTFFNNRLLALSEDDLPYEIQVSDSGDLSTVGRYDFDGKVDSPMIAHPKIDPVTGDLFALSCDVIQRPYLKYFRFDKHGKRTNDVEIPLAEPTMMHDFAITENFVVIPDQQVVFRLFEMIRGRSPLLLDKKKISRFGILKKNATERDEIRWIEVPDCFCFHFWNAWEERSSNSDDIIVIGSVMSPADSIFNEGDEILSSVLSEIRLNLRTNRSTCRPIVADLINLEVGMVNRNKLGRKTRFAFLAIADPWPKVSGFAKVNLQSGVVKKYMYGEDRYGGEPFFLPANPSTTEKEDDGYILSFVHDEREWRSELQIVNAADLSLEASVKLPSRVPYGFHGTFIKF